MKTYEVTVTARLTHFFPAEDEQSAERQMVLGIDREWQIDDVDVDERKIWLKTKDEV